MNGCSSAREGETKAILFQTRGRGKNTRWVHRAMNSLILFEGNWEGTNNISH